MRSVETVSLSCLEMDKRQFTSYPHKYIQFYLVRIDNVFYI